MEFLSLDLEINCSLICNYFLSCSWYGIDVWLPPPPGQFCGLKKPPPELRVRKQIVNNVNGIVRPGELLAIMGTVLVHYSIIII